MVNESFMVIKHERNGMNKQWEISCTPSECSVGVQQSYSMDRTRESWNKKPHPMSVSGRGWTTWDFSPLSSSFPSQALLTSAIYLYYLPTPRPSYPSPCHLKICDSVWNTANSSFRQTSIERVKLTGDVGPRQHIVTFGCHSPWRRFRCQIFCRKSYCL